MPEKPLIAKLFSGDFQKNIVQRRKLGKYSSEGDILTLQIIQKTNQIMLCNGVQESDFHNADQIHEEDCGYPADVFPPEELLLR